MAELARQQSHMRQEDPSDRTDLRRHQRRDRRIAFLMAFEAATLAIMATVHLAGLLQGSNPFRPVGAGISEAIICVALIVGVAALARGWAHHWGIAVTTTSFAVLGFVLGLSFTLRGGDAIDIAYHATVLPLLLLTLVALLRGRNRAS
jgi:hypothetical protein